MQLNGWTGGGIDTTPIDWCLFFVMCEPENITDLKTGIFKLDLFKSIAWRWPLILRVRTPCRLPIWPTPASLVF